MESLWDLSGKFAHMRSLGKSDFSSGLCALGKSDYPRQIFPDNLLDFQLFVLHPHCVRCTCVHMYSWPTSTVYIINQTSPIAILGHRTHTLVIRELKQDITSLTITSPSLHHHFLCLFVYLRFLAGLVLLSTNLV